MHAIRHHAELHGATVADNLHSKVTHIVIRPDHLSRLGVIRVRHTILFFLHLYHKVGQMLYNFLDKLLFLCAIFLNHHILTLILACFWAILGSNAPAAHHGDAKLRETPRDPTVDRVLYRDGACG